MCTYAHVCMIVCVCVIPMETEDGCRVRDAGWLLRVSLQASSLGCCILSLGSRTFLFFQCLHPILLTLTDCVLTDKSLLPSHVSSWVHASTSFSTGVPCNVVHKSRLLVTSHRSPASAN